MVISITVKIPSIPLPIMERDCQNTSMDSFIVPVIISVIIPPVLVSDLVPWLPTIASREITVTKLP